MLTVQRSRLFYLAGTIGVFIGILAGELIWIADPIRLPGGAEWIDLINPLYYGICLIPLLWLIGAVCSAAAASGLRNRIIGIVSAVLSGGSLIGFFALQRHLLIAVSLLVCAWLWTLVDLFAMEISARASAGSGRRRWPLRSTATLLIILALLVLFGWPTSYRVTYPGLTMPMNRYAHVEGGSSGGSINGVLVFERPAFPADWLYKAVFPDYELDQVGPDEPPLAEQYTEVLEMKNDANSVAGAIAMQRAGVGKGITVQGVKVAAIVAGSPADKLLRAGDVIRQLDGHGIDDLNAMTAYMKQVKAGTEVNVTLNREGKTLTVKVPTKSSEDGDNRAVFGISVQNDLVMDIPLGVSYRHYIAHIGGPSHGAMLTLAILDQLTPGGVTHGINVAGTGTIEADGSVGPVGGVRQKAYTVSRTNADVFFVPADEADEAYQGAPDLNIVPVKTLDDILNWLAAHKKA
ncbi:PDZ domain-containing protein [Paenibacillus protaetiae]|nr:PDZ domain-containing protein [Paenibacillus protaetiae]